MATLLKHQELEVQTILKQLPTLLKHREEQLASVRLKLLRSHQIMATIKVKHLRESDFC